MKKVGKLDVNGGTITICYDDKAEVNPFRIYIEYYEIGKYDYPTKRKKLIVKYANLASCTEHIHNYVKQHDIERM